MADSSRPQGSVLETFKVFLLLGLTSFGGPVAHIGYFYTAFVKRRRWLSETQFGQLLAVAQLLPGPASSQLGFAIGLVRAGGLGGLAAFTGFTLPSVVLLLLFGGLLLPNLSSDLGAAVISGFKILALVVVAHAVLGMSRQLCPDGPRALIAAGAMALLLLMPSTVMQLAVIALGALFGLAVQVDPQGDPDHALSVPYSRAAGLAALLMFSLLLVGLPILSAYSLGGQSLAFFDLFYRAGAMVFGGGHAVLPVLEAPLVGEGWLDRDTFLVGYGAAQAIPGPMFSLSAYLGSEAAGSSGFAMASLYAFLAVLAIFLPGFLLLIAALPFWQQLSSNRKTVKAIAGVNASIVGLLGATLYDPVFTQAIKLPADLAVAVIGFVLLSLRLPVLFVVLWCLLAGIWV